MTGGPRGSLSGGSEAERSEAEGAVPALDSGAQPQERPPRGDPRGPIYVAVCGPGIANDREFAWAEEVGRLLARAGAVVVCGGVSGVMDAVARGASEEGGSAIGILPAADREAASPHLTFSIPTGMGEARNALVVRAADAVIAISGEFGTLSEIALALKMGVPVVGLSTWELRRRGEPVKAFASAETPEEAVAEALRLARGRPGL